MSLSARYRVADLITMPRLVDSGVVLFAILFVLFAYTKGSNNLGIGPDTFGFISRAYAKSGFVWVNGLYPCGYPLMLRAASLLFGDYLLAGVFLSSVNAGIAIISIYWASIAVGVRSAFAFLATLMTVTTIHFANYASAASTDMPHLGLSLLGLVLILSNKKNSARLLFLGGMALGSAYLMRYTALVFLVSTLLYAFIFNSKTAIRSAAWITGGFLIVASLQLIPSLLVTGNPFFNTQFVNVQTGLMMTEGVDFWNAYQAAQEQSSQAIPSVLSSYGLNHFVNNITDILFVPEGWTSPYFGLLLIPALIFSFNATYNRSELGLVLFWFLAYASSISIAFHNPRLLLPLVPLAYLMILSMISKWDAKVLKLSISWVLLLALIFLQVRWIWVSESARSQTYHRTNEGYIAVSSYLRQNNAFEEHSAALLTPLCGGVLYYDIESPTKQSVNILNVQSKSARTPLGLKTLMQDNRIKYLLVEPCNMTDGLEWLQADSLPRPYIRLAQIGELQILQLETGVEQR